MTTPTTPPAPSTVEDAMLLDIVTDPHDVAVRLVYADWLAERDGPGDRERAEFVQVQCEIAHIEAAGTADPKRGLSGGPFQGWEYKTPPDFLRLTDLRRRERELLGSEDATYRLSRRGASVTVATDRSVKLPEWLQRSADVGEVPALDGMAFTFRRGFIEEVRLPLAAFMEHGAALVTRCPLTRVTLSDREPMQSPGWAGVARWHWYTLAKGDGQSHWLPKEFHPKALWPAAEWYLSLPHFRTSDAALDALSHACLTLARERAGLPPLPAPPPPEAAR